MKEHRDKKKMRKYKEDHEKFNFKKDYEKADLFEAFTKSNEFAFEPISRTRLGNQHKIESRPRCIMNPLKNL